MSHRRIIVYSEPEKNQSLKGSVIKELTGSGCINARALYSKKTNTILHGTHIILANEIPILDNVDNAIKDRLLILKFQSKFCTKDQIAKIPEDQRQFAFPLNTYYKSKECIA